MNNSMQFVSLACSLAFLGVFIWYLSATHPRARRIAGVWTVVVAIAVGILAVSPPWEKIKLGIDLEGGTEYRVQVQNVSGPQVLDQAIEVFRKRLDEGGGRNLILQPVGDNRISVQIPGTSEEQRKADREALSRVAKLEFKLVHPNNETIMTEVRANDGVLPAQYAFDWMILPQQPEKDREGNEIEMPPLVVKRLADIGGKTVSSAARGFSPSNLPAVDVVLNSEGGEKMLALTTENLGNRMAVVLDDEIITAPSINGIFSTKFQVSGGRMSGYEAERLASVLENPLEEQVELLSSRDVDPSLGLDSIRSGWQAGLISIAGVVVFMIIYYRVAGMVSVIALSLNMLLLLGMLAEFRFTLTLPGIAGIILTIGMAVDANVLIYERIRDELRTSGGHLRQAVDLGFGKAFSAIVDSNITTLIAAVVLYITGTGPLRGFAITLTLGILANLFTALVVTRVCFEWLLHWKVIKSLAMMQFLRLTKFNFLSFRWGAIAASAVIIGLGVLTFQQRGEEMFGVDFLGGDSVLMSYEERVPVGELREAVTGAGIEATLFQYAANDNSLTFQTRVGEGEAAVELLRERFADAGLQKSSIESVGAQVSEELKSRALIALGLGLLGILIYATIRFEWSYALAATAGQIHDVLLVLAVMALLGKELTLLEVAALLAIAGYSINDKIVIFDRIREAFRQKEKGSIYELINRGLNRSLARTLLTSGTTLVACLALMIFGGPVIYDFSLAVFIGVIGGTYSSNFISPAIAYWFNNYKDRHRKNVVPSEPSPSPAS
ncbi:MAG: protein translocase subunit SecD [Verrucomicrobiota bacterium]